MGHHMKINFDYSQMPKFYKQLEWKKWMKQIHFSNFHASFLSCVCMVPKLWLILVIGVQTNIHEMLAIEISKILLLQTPKQ